VRLDRQSNRLSSEKKAEQKEANNADARGRASSDRDAPSDEVTANQIAAAPQAKRGPKIVSIVRPMPDGWVPEELLAILFMAPFQGNKLFESWTFDYSGTSTKAAPKHDVPATRKQIRAKEDKAGLAELTAARNISNQSLAVSATAQKSMADTMKIKEQREGLTHVPLDLGKNRHPKIRRNREKTA